MFLFSAFALGFAGSFHCVAMCGPISLALMGSSSKRSFWHKKLLYSLGRITSYVMLGMLVGTFGHSLDLIGAQQYLSITIGIMWLLILLLLPDWENRLLKFPLIRDFFFRIKKGLGQLLQNQGSSRQFNAGILNGFLPCGLVYLGLSGALLSGEIQAAMMYMLFFGLGTFPAMFFLAFLNSYRRKFTWNLRPIMYYASLVFAIFLILRGLELDIPFISPVLAASSEPEMFCK